MGVRGLQRFLKNNSAALSQKIEITNTSLVIDANNLVGFLFCELCEDQNSKLWRCDIYGGDLVAYGEAVREFFANLDKCRITPILVFDGSTMGKPVAGDKRQEQQKSSKEEKKHIRGKERFELAKQMTEQCPTESIIMPKSLSYIFKNIVKELGLQRIQTPYGADAHIAQLANERDCYVLTNDSDFIIYSLPKGFVMLDSFEFKNIITAQDGRHLIGCVAFSQDKLVRCFPGLKSESLPLVSVLLGNDHVDLGTFENFIKQIVYKSSTSSLAVRTWADRRIVAILTWLRNKTTLEESIEQLLRQSGYFRQDEIEQEIKTRLRGYCVENAENLEAELSEIYAAEPARSEPLDKSVGRRVELSPSAYLSRLFEAADLQPIALEMMLHNTCYDYPSIDDPIFPESANHVQNRPFSLAITLLRSSSSGGTTTNERKNESERNAFHTYCRTKDDYCKTTLRPMEHLDGFGSLEHISCYSMILLEPERKKSLLMHTFRFNSDELNQMTDILSRVFESQFVNEASTCLLLVNYIGLETRCKPKRQFVDALMLTLFYYAALNGQLKTNSFVDTNYGQLLLRLRPHSFINNGEHYAASPLYRRIMHFISQLEAAYLSYCLLNSLLNHVFQAPRYEQFLNGTLVFRLTELLRVGGLQMATLCNEMPALAEACASIKLMVHSDE